MYHGAMDNTLISYQEQITSLVESLVEDVTKETIDTVSAQVTPLSTYLCNSYKERMLELLDDQNVPLYLREHYAESPHFYGNQSESSMIDTMRWMSYSDETKTRILDQELDDMKIEE